jgi:hypothetical protein
MLLTTKNEWQHHSRQSEHGQEEDQWMLMINWLQAKLVKDQYSKDKNIITDNNILVYM